MSTYLQVREITFCNFLSILRIILPERVLGKPETNCIFIAIGLRGLIYIG
jgi:hypothetical protein